MTDEPEQKQAFKVEDRRRFSASGDARDSAAEETPAPETVEKPAAAAPTAAGAQRPAGPAAEINFSTFVLSLSTQALAHLGEIPSLVDGQLSKDLVAAKQLIDILGVLDDKTKGNLDAAEAALLTNVLYDLRLKYVEQARRA